MITSCINRNQKCHLWRRLAELSTQLGFLRQVIYCLCKARCSASPCRP